MRVWDNLQSSVYSSTIIDQAIQLTLQSAENAMSREEFASRRHLMSLMRGRCPWLEEAELCWPCAHGSRQFMLYV